MACDKLYSFIQNQVKRAIIKSKFKILSGDAQICGEIHGDEHLPCLILLHGNGEDLHYFDPQICYFRKSYRIIAIDSRAHGLSTRGTKPLDFHTMAEDTLAVLDALRVEQAHFLGFSDGANLALHVAIKAPHRIQSMILLGANYSPSGFRWDVWIQTRWMHYMLIAASFFSKKAKQKHEIWNLMVHHPKLTLAEIAQIQAPTLIITGEKDMVSQQENDEIHHAIVGSERVIIAGANHFLSSNRADEFNEIAARFLDSTSCVRNCTF